VNNKRRYIMGRTRKDLIGLSFGKLSVVELHSKDRNGHFRYICKCECGNTHTALDTHLKYGKIKSCGCDIKSGKNHKQWTGYEGLSGTFWNQIKRGADGTKGRKKMEFSITIEYAWNLIVEQKFKCALSGMDIYLQPNYNTRPTASLDRVDSSKGYVVGNVQWVHKDINKMKNSFDQNYFKKLCALVSENYNCVEDNVSCNETRRT
jgi:hypothetical protein